MTRSSDDRRHVMRLAALATSDELRAAMDALETHPTYRVVRAPETGLVMIEGRMGGDGARFNVGEATVSRSVVKLETGELGFAYLLGRRLADAERAAVLDAMSQRPDSRAVLDTALIEPVTARLAGEAARRHADADATRVSFFTLERGESPA